MGTYNPTQELTLDDFNYELPETRIAQHPVEPRDTAKLLVRTREGNICDRYIYNLPEILRRPCLFIINETKVRPARIFGKLVTGGKVELLLTQRLSAASLGQANVWAAVAKPMRKLSTGTKIAFEGGMCAVVLERSSEMEVRVQFQNLNLDFDAWLTMYGMPPLPPYIRRKNDDSAQRIADLERYQTVFAKEVGSAAAPTAGLHFTPDLVAKLRDKGHSFAPVTLHVGLGTFLPVKVQNLDGHHMHTEQYYFPRNTLDAIRVARRADQDVVAIGTTSLRCLLSFFKDGNGIEENEDENCDTWRSTDLFVRPRTETERVRLDKVTGILTNFHQPKSTLLMLVSALIGFAATRDVYRHALEHEYRFLSYGDGCLFWL